MGHILGCEQLIEPQGFVRHEGSGLNLMLGGDVLIVELHLPSTNGLAALNLRFHYGSGIQVGRFRHVEGIDERELLGRLFVGIEHGELSSAVVDFHE